MSRVRRPGLSANRSVHRAVFRASVGQRRAHLWLLDRGCSWMVWTE